MLVHRIRKTVVRLREKMGEIEMLNFLLGAAVAVICICLGVVLGKAVDE